MTCHVFFSFKYEPDVWRANAIRNQVHVLGGTSIGYWDDSIYEPSLAQNPDYIKRKIREALEGTTVTVFLITSKTQESEYVQYEYLKSVERRNGILQLDVSSMKDRFGNPEIFRGWLPYINHGFSAK